MRRRRHAMPELMGHPDTVMRRVTQIVPRPPDHAKQAAQFRSHAVADTGGTAS
jgi:hypothetical protein